MIDSSINRLSDSAGVVVSPDALEAAQTITESDVELKPRVKPLQFLAVFQAEGLRLEAKRRTDSRRAVLLDRAQRMLEQGCDWVVVVMAGLRW